MQLLEFLKICHLRSSSKKVDFGTFCDELLTVEQGEKGIRGELAIGTRKIELRKIIDQIFFSFLSRDRDGSYARLM